MCGVHGDPRGGCSSDPPFYRFSCRRGDANGANIRGFRDPMWIDLEVGRGLGVTCWSYLAADVADIRDLRGVKVFF